LGSAANASGAQLQLSPPSYCLSGSAAIADRAQ
jgi:hypothetical protein